MTRYIYLLEFEDKSLYIGQTTNLNRRMRQHVTTYGQSFSCTIIDECAGDKAILTECMWIQLFYSWGFMLKNYKPWTNVNTKQRLIAGSKIIKNRIDINDYLISERMIKLPRRNPLIQSVEDFNLLRRRIIGSWIEYLREIENVTQRQVADHLGIEQSTLCKIESGKRNYSAITLLLICKYLKVDYKSTLEIFI